MNKKYFLYAIVPVLALAAAGGMALADTTNQPNNPMSNLVNAIAQKFNLNVSDVQQVFDEQHSKTQAERQQQMQQKFSDRLNKAVSDGKITQDQANLISAKHTEMQNYMKSLEGKTPEEIKTAMKAQIDSLKQWAEDNNIPMQYVQFGGKGFGKGMGMGSCPFKD